MTCNHLMLDLETLSTEPDAAIVSIGAVVFTPKRVLFENAVFDWKCDVIESANHGHVDMSTICWWMRQSDEARRSAFFPRPDGTLADGLKFFSVFVQKFDVGYVWGNGAAFDNVVLRNAYKKLGLKAPWSFRADMCYRTVKNLYPETEFERIGVYHNAVDDAHSQAAHLLKLHDIAGVLDDI